VSKALAEGKSVPIRAEAGGQILSNQKIYGIWGLYSVASVSSGWVETEGHRLTREAIKHLESHTLPLLQKKCPGALGRIRAFLIKDRSFRPTGADKALAKGLAHVLRPQLDAVERSFYGRHLVLAETSKDPTKGRQGLLWQILGQLNDDGPFAWDEPFSYLELVEARKRSGAVDTGLERALSHIETVEPLFATSAMLFGFMLARREAKVDEVADSMMQKLGSNLDHIRAESIRKLHSTMERASSTGVADKLVSLAGSLCKGEYRRFISTAMDLNAQVMKARNGDAWVVKRKGRLHVRLRSETSYLPGPDELPELWINSYFINSFKEVGAEVMDKR